MTRGSSSSMIAVSASAARSHSRRYGCSRSAARYSPAAPAGATPYVWKRNATGAKNASAIDNVATPLLYQGVGRSERQRRAREALEKLGLGDRAGHEPTELSGGQQQRVAVARALVTEPALILADEPTGNLDSHAGAEVIALLRQLHDTGRTVVLITHDAAIAAMADRQIRLLDGRVAAEAAA